MTPPVIHKSFTIERTYGAPVARVSEAHSNPKQKRRWFAEGEGFIVDSYSLDFSVGGFERARFRFGSDGPPMTYDGVYLDIAPNQRGSAPRRPLRRSGITSPYKSPDPVDPLLVSSCPTRPWSLRQPRSHRLHRTGSSSRKTPAPLVRQSAPCNSP